jgi:hypothetical protein
MVGGQMVENVEGKGRKKGRGGREKKDVRLDRFPFFLLSIISSTIKSF